MNRLAAIHRDRTERRRLLALSSAQYVLDKAQLEGVRISVTGSLTGAQFQLHSDVDLFVHDQTNSSMRVAVERLVAHAFKGTGIPYDVIYASDLTVRQAREFMNA